jgi:hypothetical protein
MNKKTLYIGASYDTEFLFILNSEKFIFIDPSPNSEGMGYNDTKFLEILLVNLDNAGYALKNREIYEKLEKDNKLKVFLEFENNLQEDKVKTLRYYVNTFFPEDIDKINGLKSDISDIDMLIMKGFIPSYKILNYQSNPITLILSDTTCYIESDKYELEQFGPSIVDYMYKHQDNLLGIFIKEIKMYRRTYKEYSFNNISEAQSSLQVKLLGGEGYIP